MVLKHNADLQACYDVSGRQRDEVVELTGDELAKKLDVYRRAQRHRSGARGTPLSSTSQDTIVTSAAAGNTAGHEAAVVDLSTGQKDLLDGFWSGDVILEDLARVFSVRQATTRSSTVTSDDQASLAVATQLPAPSSLGDPPVGSGYQDASQANKADGSTSTDPGQVPTPAR